MKINVICSDVGGIYSKFIVKLREFSKHQILLNSKEQCDITHYLPCYEMPENPNRPCTVWLSHQETRQDLFDKFISSTKNANIAMSHSKKYMDLMISQGIKNVIQVMPGVDFKRFELRSSARQAKDKLVIGYVGKQFSSSERKNPKLLEKISNLPFVEFKATGGRMREADLPKFYASLDITVSPATIEGGPMAIQESLAVGTPVMCFENVGMANEFLHGVMRIPLGRDDAFIKQLETFWARREFLVFRRPDVMKVLRAQVERFTWEHFVEEHDKIWTKISIKEK